MRSSTLLAAALVAETLSSGAMAAPFDGSQPFICASVELYSCVAGSECQHETPESINVPQFLRVDVQRKEVKGMRADGSIRATPISAASVGDALGISGTENQFGWSMMVDASGKMTLTAAGTVAGERTALTVFGACTLQDAFEATTAPH